MKADKAYTRAKKLIAQAKTKGSTELGLSCLGLKTVPPEIGQLKKLQRLYLSGNSLSVLPKEIGQLKNLNYLYLTSNAITKLPPEIGALEQLQELYLSFNQLIELPEEIGILDNLKVLQCERNNLTSLPKSIAKLKQLEILSLEQNMLKTLPKEVGQLTKLFHLLLKNNRLSYLTKEIGQLKQLEVLDLSHNSLSKLPLQIGQLENLEVLLLTENNLSSIPIELSQLKQLMGLNLERNALVELPPQIGQLENLEILLLNENNISYLPIEVCQLKHLKRINLSKNSLSDLPTDFRNFSSRKSFDYDLSNNPLNSDLQAAYEDSRNALSVYLESKLGNQTVLNEAKLILVGEGEVGKTCLTDALQNLPWKTHESTHGIKIKEITLSTPNSQEITFNCWDFGGQRVYRPTHQLFFSPNAVYLVVWKPRSGTNQGMVKDWIRLVKYREPDAKILIVATHGGPNQRQADIDRQELWDLFGKETIIDFFTIDSKPDPSGTRVGIEELKTAIAKVAQQLPEIGRSVSDKWQKTREKLANLDEAYLPLHKVLEICSEFEMDKGEAKLFLRISHRLGYLIHYENDATVQDLVVLKPDWLATAISFVFDDKETRVANGLISFERFNQLWNDPKRITEERYPENLHPVFLRLMERFDLSYKVADESFSERNPTSLIAQLVLDNRSEESLALVWPEVRDSNDKEKIQICEVVNEDSQSANAEGLFYQLIVRFHKYSLGRENYNDSVHWQKGLVLDADYLGRALLEHIGNNIRITVRAAYPEGLLSMLTSDIKYLVEEFWEGLRCNIMVPCVDPCGKSGSGSGRFEVEKLIIFKRQGLDVFPCMAVGCGQLQNINTLLSNAPANQSLTQITANEVVIQELRTISAQITNNQSKNTHRFDTLDTKQEELLSKVDTSYLNLLETLTDEAKDGPRLFSFVPVDQRNFNPETWTKEKFIITLWCEHSRRPLPRVYGDDSKGICEIELTRDWLKQAAPYIKRITGVLKLVAPAVFSYVDLQLDDKAFKNLDEQLKFSEKVVTASLGGAKELTDFASGESLAGKSDMENAEQSPFIEKLERDVEYGTSIRGEGGSLRALHALLKEKDPTFGGLVRVMNKRQEFLWVHPAYVDEY